MEKAGNLLKPTIEENVQSKFGPRSLSQPKFESRDLRSGAFFSAPVFVWLLLSFSFFCYSISKIDQVRR